MDFEWIQFENGHPIDSCSSLLDMMHLLAERKRIPVGEPYYRSFQVDELKSPPSFEWTALITAGHRKLLN
ncbi:hypothetical protein M514_01140 [Trichuris suis]|uniref:Uncharacterized protein n=1 Tax=Trichuris suis TaxID=68888 RepID=A0A085NN72_9BILA|nr:hypothetical protein M513_01140 [Trichuris suis]KFD70918.1 hypothetical protein M514_01140 [Trichuris suis]